MSMADRLGTSFLSTTLNLGCGSGYYGSQMHWNTSAMNLDWAVWDIGSTKNQHPINPTNADGKPVDRQGNLCSTTEPPPKGFTGCPCSRCVALFSDHHRCAAGGEACQESRQG